MKNILIPTDYSECAKNAQKKMGCFLKGQSDYVNNTVDIGKSSQVILEYIKENDIDLVIMGMKGVSGLKKLAEQFDFDNYTLNAYNDVSEEEGVLSLADDIGADMIAIGTHGLRGINHLVSVSIAENVVNHTHRTIPTYHIRK